MPTRAGAAVFSVITSYFDMKCIIRYFTPNVVAPQCWCQPALYIYIYRGCHQDTALYICVHMQIKSPTRC